MNQIESKEVEIVLFEFPIESTLLKTIFNPMCCNITPMYFPHFSADKKICGCCVNLGKPIIGSNKWTSLQQIVNYNVAQRNVLSKKFGSYHGIFVWTIDDPQQMEWLISSGIDGIITNQPNKLVQLVRNQTHIRRPRFNLT